MVRIFFNTYAGTIAMSCAPRLFQRPSFILEFHTPAVESSDFLLES